MCRPNCVGLHGSKYTAEGVKRRDTCAKPTKRAGRLFSYCSFVMIENNNVSAWSEEEKRELESYHNFCGSMINFCNKMQACIAKVATTGNPLQPEEVRDIKMPKIPKMDIKKLLCKSNDTNQLMEVESPSVNNMNAYEFNIYLQSLVIDTTQTAPEIDVSVNLDHDAMEVLVTKVKDIYTSVKKADHSALTYHVHFGLIVIKAHRAFKINKAYSQSVKWEKWITDKTQISSSYIRKHRQMAELCQLYPKLRCLSIPFTTFYDMHKKIKEMFVEYPDIAAHWTTNE